MPAWAVTRRAARPLPGQLVEDLESVEVDAGPPEPSVGQGGEHEDLEEVIPQVPEVPPGEEGDASGGALLPEDEAEIARRDPSASGHGEPGRRAHEISEQAHQTARKPCQEPGQQIEPEGHRDETFAFPRVMETRG